MSNSVVQQVNAELEELKLQLASFKSSVLYLNNAKKSVSEAVEAVQKVEKHFNERIEELKSTYKSFIQLSENAESLIQRITSINFPERLDNIQAGIENTTNHLNDIKDATIIELQKAANAITQIDFEKKFDSLNKLVDTSVQSNSKMAEEISQMQIPKKINDFEQSISKTISESYKELEQNTRKIAADTSKAIFDLNLPVRIDKLDANIAGISASIQNVQGRLDTIENNIKDRIASTSEKQLQFISSFQEKVMQRFSKAAEDFTKKQKSQLLLSIVTIIIVLLMLISTFISKYLAA